MAVNLNTKKTLSVDNLWFHQTLFLERRNILKTRFYPELVFLLVSLTKREMFGHKQDQTLFGDHIFFRLDILFDRV